MNGQKNNEIVNFIWTIADDVLRTKKFDFMLTNPPYGKSWKKDRKEITRRWQKNKRPPLHSRPAASKRRPVAIPLQYGR